MGALGTPPKTVMPTDKGTSAPMHTAVGSGSRPGAAKMPIKSSAPVNQHTMDRNPPPGWLK